MRKEDLPTKFFLRGDVIYYRPNQWDKMSTSLKLCETSVDDLYRWIKDNDLDNKKKRAKHKHANWPAKRLYPIFLKERKECLRGSKPPAPAAGTIRNWERAILHLEKHKIWRLMPLKDVEFDDCLAYVNEMSGRGFDPRRDLKLVKAMHNWFRRAGVFRAYTLEFSTDTEKPDDEKVGRRIEDWEVIRLDKAVFESRSPYARAKYELGKKYGMRKNEILKLKKGWLKAVSIKGQIIYYIALPAAYVKNRRARNVIIREEMYRLLQPFMIGKGDDDCLFTEVKNITPDTRVHDGAWWREARKRAEITCRFHDLRYTCATVMAEEGIPQEIAIQQLGHDRMVNNIYTRKFNIEKIHNALNLTAWQNRWEHLSERPIELSVEQLQAGQILGQSK